MQRNYSFEDDGTYVKIKKEDFEEILRERRVAFFLSKFVGWIALVVSIAFAGTTYWFNEHPVTKVLMVAPANMK